MIHCYKNNGYNIVLDVNSGSVHVVDDIIYDDPLWSPYMAGRIPRTRIHLPGAALHVGGLKYPRG